jgi:hypothetical protein
MTPQTSCLLHYSYCCSTAGTMSKHGPPWHVGSLSRDVWNEKSLNQPYSTPPPPTSPLNPLHSTARPPPYTTP